MNNISKFCNFVPKDCKDGFVIVNFVLCQKLIYYHSFLFSKKNICVFLGKYKNRLISKKDVIMRAQTGENK